MDNVQHEKPWEKKSQAISKERWEEMKNTILSLYSRMQLCELVTYLGEHNQFWAT